MRHVLVTNPEPHATTLARLLTEGGCLVVKLALFTMGPPSDGGAVLRKACADLTRFDWVAFTSQFAVDAVACNIKTASPVASRQSPAVQMLPATGNRRPATALLGASWPDNGPRIAAVGESTAEAVRSYGWTVDCVAAKGNAASLAQALAAGGIARQRVLVPQAARARPELVEGLRQAGAVVDAVVAYAAQPVQIDAAKWLREHGNVPFDAVVFTAPSATERFVGLFGPPPLAAPFTGAHWFAIGPTTAESARAVGLIPCLAPAQATFSALAECICRPGVPSNK